MGTTDALREEGYAVARGVFAPGEVREVAAEMDRLVEAARRHPRSFREGNLLWVVRPDSAGAPRLRFVHWVAWASELLARLRLDERLLALVEPLVGRDVRQVVNTASWKEPGSGDTTFGWHQDARFRRPEDAYRDLWGTSYVHTLLAVDPHRVANGCLRVVRGSHRWGPVSFPADRSVMDLPCDEASLSTRGIDPARVVPLELEPGDVALWLAATVHGSEENRSSADRRAVVNGYARAASTDRGEWAFRDGRPCALSTPSLCQYEDLPARPEPHYVEGALYPPARRGS